MTWTTIGYLTGDPAIVYAYPWPSPGEIECCEKCMSAVREGRGSTDLHVMGLLHMQHAPIPLTVGFDGATTSGSQPGEPVKAQQKHEEGTDHG